MSRPLHQLADALSKRGMVVLISDLLDDPAAVIRGLKHFQYRGTDVIVFHVLDPDELEFPFERADPLRGSGDARRGDGRARRRARATICARSWARSIDRYRRELGGWGIDYHLRPRTSEPLELALLAYLSTRSKTL